MFHIIHRWGLLVGTLGLLLTSMSVHPTLLPATMQQLPNEATRPLDNIQTIYSTNEAKNIRLRGNLGGSIQAVAVQGNYAYVGEGYSLTVLNLANPVTPKVVGSVGLMFGTIAAIVVQGDYAYVADGWGYALHIIDLSNPDRPLKVGSFHAGWDTNDLFVAYPYVYLIDTGRDDSNVVHLLNVSDPTAPVAVGKIATFYDVHDIAAQGNYLYVADGSALQIFDISTPATPVKAGEYAPANGVSRVAVAGAYAYIAGYNGNLAIVDVSQPNTPTLVGTYSGEGTIEKVVVVGSLVYLASGDNGLQIINIASPTAPFKVGSLDTPDSTKKLAVAGSYVYLADTSSLVIADVSNPAAPQGAGSYRVPLSAYGVALASPSSNILYLAGGYNDGLSSIDISNPALLKSVGFYPGTTTAVSVLGDYAYLVGGYNYTFKMLHITDPQALQLAGVFTGTASMNRVDTDYSYTYLANDYKGLRIIDSTNPQNLREVGFYDTPGNANGVVVGGNYAYVADGDAGVQVINISNPAAPVFVSNYNTPGTAYDLYLNAYLYVADGYNGLSILSVTNPNALTEVGVYDSPGSALGVYVAGNLAYLADSSGGLRLINVSNPGSPMEVGFYDLPNALDVIAAADGWIYVAAGDAGLLSLHYPDCYRLFRSRTGQGANPTAIPDHSTNCPPGEYTPQQFITLVSGPAPSWRVTGWIGTSNDNTTSTNNQLIMPAADHEVIVHYAPTCYRLTLTHSGGGLDPTATPANSEGCAPGQYIAGATISLRAAPNAGYIVGSWNGTANNSNNALDNTVTMPAANHTAGVNYELACYQLTLTHSGEGSDPTATPGQSTGCAAGRYHFNEPLSLSAATPASGWQIASWSGTANNASTAASNSLTMPPNDHTASVQYSLLPTGGEGDVYELDNLCTRSRLIAADGSETQEHSFHAANDLDWVRFNATANVTYRVEVRVPATSTADVNLEVYGLCEGAVLDQWNASFSPEVRLDFKAPASGPIYLRLANQPANVAGSQVQYAITVRPLEQASTNRALILVAGRLKGTDNLQQNIHNVTNAVYKLFQRNGYDDEHIHYLATDANLPGRDGSLTRETLRVAITEWAKSKLSADGVLTLYLMDHGSPDLFYLDETQGQRLTPADLNEWLNAIEQAVPNLKVNVIIEACQSGSFITPPQTISKAGRVILTSTTTENDAKASKDGAYFSDHFLTWLHQGYNLFASFSEAQTVAQSIFALQKAQLDADGNGVPNEFSDGALAAKRSFAYAGSLPADDWPPHIFSVQGPSSIVNASGVIQAEVRDNLQVRQVWAVVYPPDYAPPPTGQQLQPEVLPTILFTLADESKQLYAGKFTGFTQSGAYRLVVHAEDADGLVARPVVLEVNPTGGQVFLPVVGR